MGQLLPLQYHHLGQVADLLEVAFQHVMDREGRASSSTWPWHRNTVAGASPPHWSKPSWRMYGDNKAPVCGWRWTRRTRPPDVSTRPWGLPIQAPGTDGGSWCPGLRLPNRVPGSPACLCTGWPARFGSRYTPGCAPGITAWYVGRSNRPAAAMFWFFMPRGGWQRLFLAAPEEVEEEVIAGLVRPLYRRPYVFLLDAPRRTLEEVLPHLGHTHLTRF